jgi:hypothetical protein
MKTWHCGIFGRRGMLILGLLLFGCGFVLYHWWNAGPEPSGDAADVAASGAAVAGDAAASTQSKADAALRRLALGVWEDDFHGRRTMTLREDGSGTMVVELQGIEATLFASKLTFEMLWSVRDGRMQMRTTGGEPAGRVKLVLKLEGDRVDQPIVELSEGSLVLLDKDGKTKYNWRRKG